MGYDAITLNSETASLPSQLDAFLAIYSKVIILYDIDETGKINAARLSKKHGFAVCTLPTELLAKGGKDISDYIRLGMPKEKLYEIIQDSSITVLQEKCTVTEAENLVGDVQKICTTTPHLTDEIYALIPDTLKDICSKFEDRREKDVCLLSCITVLSTCFPTIQGIYDNRRLGCNFNLFITAPASAGKGIMSWSRLLGNKIDSHLKWLYKNACERYKAALEAYNTQEGKSGEKPEPPKEPMLFIPANSSTSSIYECLDGNHNFGIIFDNEGDTLSSIMKNDWADFSSLIRKGFHHENVEMKRRTNNEYRRVNRPHISLLLSGTRNQVTKLIDSVENGLFSRFGFYDFELDLQWKDKFGNKDSGLEDFFESHGSRLLEYWKRCEKVDEILCLIDDDERGFIFDYFKEKLSSLYSLHGEDIIANVRRTCIIYYRIAMILTALRFFEQPHFKETKIPHKMIIQKDQSRCAFLIVDTLLKHLEFVYARIQKTGAVSKLNPMQQSLYNLLPTEFSWQDFLAAATECGITDNKSRCREISEGLYQWEANTISRTRQVQEELTRFTPP